MSNLKALFHTVKELLYILDKRQKRKAMVVLLLLFVRAGLELIGIAALLPLLQMMLTPQKIMNDPKIILLMHFFHIQSETSLLYLIGAGVAFVYIAKNAVILFTNYVQYGFSTQMKKEISIKMLDSYLKRSYVFFLDANSSEIIRGCSVDVDQTYSIIEFIFTIIAETVTMLVIGIYIICADPLIACAMIILMLILMVVMVVVFKPIAKRAGVQNMEAVSLQNKVLIQTITGIKEIMVMQKKALFAQEYEDAAELARRATKKNTFIGSCPDRIVEGICASALVLCVCIRMQMGTDAAQFIPVLGTFAMAAFKMLPSIGKITSRMTGIIYARPYLENLYQNIKEAEEYEQIKQEEISMSKVRKAAPVCLNFEHQLCVNNIIWKYQNQEHNVLNKLSLIVHKGESVAFIGTSGAGKTTLADIILGLLMPQQGKIEMDGMDIYTISETWAKIIGYVPQMIFLKDDSIRNNVAFGVMDEDIDDESVWYALEQAQLRSFVENLPNKLDTIVGERGIKFSGGQRQRVAIARALYHKPQILVLDEATAALDNETETAVMESIDALQGQITMIIVAHRLSTIKNCDKIYEIKDGVAVERSKKEVLG